MCSNTSLSNGGGCGGNNVGDYLHSKKAKRQRVPKRGPGVAELEKILRDQQQEKRSSSSSSDLDCHRKIENDGFSSVSTSCYHPQIQPKNISFSANPNNFIPPTPSSFHNNPNNNNGNGNNPPLRSGKNGGSVQIAGSGVFLPEDALLPTMWNSYQPPARVDVGGDRRSVHGFQFSSNSINESDHNINNNNINHHHHHHHQMVIPPSMKNLFPHQPVVSASSTSDLPSNQTSNHHCSSSVWPQEDEIIGAKRPRPFSMEIPPMPPLQYQIPMFVPRITRLDDSSFPCGGRSFMNLEQQSETVSRRVKPVSSSMESIIKTCNTENVANANFLLFGSPPTPPSSTQRERPKLISFPFQESNVECLQHVAVSEDGSTQNKKPFYSFLLPREQKGMVERNLLCSSNDRTEARENGIDLNLKL